MPWQFLIKLNIYLPCKLAVTLLGIYPREMKTYLYTKKLSMNVCSSFVSNNWKLEMYLQCTVQRYFKEWMVMCFEDRCNL